MARTDDLSPPPDPAAAQVTTLSPRLPGFTVLRELGKGSMGRVLLVRRGQSEPLRALKMIPDEKLDDPGLVARFEFEAKAAALVVHPGVVRVYDLHYIDGVPAIEMEYIDGEDVRRALRRGPFTLERAVHVIAQVAAGLDAAHAHNLVHRDVKPSNVLLAHNGRAAIADFGVAWHQSSQLTKSERFFGSFPYASPEQFEGAELDRRSDIYSFGCLAIELLTGEAPFVEPSDAALMKAHLTKPPPTIAPRLGLSTELDNVMARAMAKNPKDRYESAGIFAADFAKAIGHTLPVADLHACQTPGQHQQDQAGTTPPETIDLGAHRNVAPGQGPKTQVHARASSTERPDAPTLPPGHPIPTRSNRRRRTLAISATTAIVGSGGAVAMTRLVHNPDSPGSSSTGAAAHTTPTVSEPALKRATQARLVASPTAVTAPSATITLRARVSSTSTVEGGRCVFERKLPAGWTAVGRAPLAAGSCRLRTSAGDTFDSRNYFRVRFLGTDSHAASRSRAITVVIRARVVASQPSQPAASRGGTSTPATPPAGSGGGFVTIN